MTLQTKTCLKERPIRKNKKNNSNINWEEFEKAGIGHQTHSAHTVFQLLRDLHYYDLEAPYQRDECWAEKAEINLIQSIFRNVPIGAIHVVKKYKDSPFCFVLDAKQRLTAVKRFTENKFKVSYHGKEYEYRDLQKEENKHLLDIFEKFVITLVEWQPMSLLFQRDIFDTINCFATLNTAEKIYCPNFLARSLFKYIYTECFQCLAENIRGEIKNDKRFSGVMWTHRICYLIFGEELQDSFSIRGLDISNLTKSSRKLDNRLCNYFGQNVENFKQSLIDEEVIKSLDLEENIDCLKRLSQTILNCLHFKNTNFKKENAIDIMDFLSFSSMKIQENILTISQIQDNLSVFHDFYCNFKKEKELKNMARHTTDKESITIRRDIFNKLFDQLPIDKGFKNKGIKINDKANAILNSDDICPITGAFLTKENIAFDHKQPKSKCSEFEVRVISKEANRLKSNLTENNMEEFLNYMRS